MPRTPVTAEALAKFGPGDQLQIIWPGEDLVIVTEILKLEIRPEANPPELRDDIPELYVEYKDAMAIYEGRPTPRPDYYFYQERLREDIFVSREEEGFTEILNIGGEQILLLTKSTHQAFIRL
ncbi:MAG: hypothetical protein AAB638_00900 [Patescibacteria group bacterium]